MMNTVLITEDQSQTLLQYLRVQAIDFEFVAAKNQLVFYRDHSIMLTFRLPISMDSPQAFYDYPEDRANYVLLMIRSGIASAGYFEDGMNMDHKVFRAYMVRKKQGMSQVKYLKTKGKSRAGSRVRLAGTVEFFEEINQRLQVYFAEKFVNRIGISCPTTLVPYLYGSKIATPFEKDDPRILKIPKHVQNPTYESLMETNNYLLKGEIKYTEEGAELFHELNNMLEKSDNLSTDEDW